MNTAQIWLGILGRWREQQNPLVKTERAMTEPNRSIRDPETTFTRLDVAWARGSCLSRHCTADLRSDCPGIPFRDHRLQQTHRPHHWGKEPGSSPSEVSENGGFGNLLFCRTSGCGHTSDSWEHRHLQEKPPKEADGGIPENPTQRTGAPGAWGRPAWNSPATAQCNSRTAEPLQWGRRAWRNSRETVR